MIIGPIFAGLALFHFILILCTKLFLKYVQFRTKINLLSIPKVETSQPILPYSSGQNSLTERPQILGRALCCCCRITVSRESCRLGDVLTNKPCYAEAVLRLRLTSLLLIKSGLIFAYALLLYTFF